MTKPSFVYANLEKREIGCPLCRGREFRPLASQDRYDMGVTTVGCLGCGLILTNPRPTPAALADFYRHHYRAFYRKLEAPTAEYIRAFGLDRRATYATDFFACAGLLHPSSRVLDVGCAEGSLLLEIRRRYPQATLAGVEPGEGFSRYCRDTVGCPVFESLEKVRGGPEVFDLIIAVHVIEHVDDPVEFLKGLGALLAPGGTVYVDVPNAGAYSSLDDLHLAHLFHFSRATLALAATKAGLSVERMETHSPPRHPPSVRALLRREATGGASEPPPDEREAVFQRVATVGRKTCAYRLRRTLPVRVVAGCWKRVRRLLAGSDH